MNVKRIFQSSLFACGVMVCGCSDGAESQSAGGASAAVPTASAEITNRVDVPEAVRRNLGITFARVEQRAVAETLRVPGRFELMPDARREYRTMLAGRVELLVQQYQQVEAGTPLYRLDSPPWRELQQKLSEADAARREAEKRAEMIPRLLEAHEQHHRSVEEQLRILIAQLERLQTGAESGSVSTAELAQSQSAVAAARIRQAESLEKEVELEVMRVEATARLDAARNRFDLLLDTAATVLDASKTDLTQPDRTSSDARPLWRTLDHVVVLASSRGQIESVALTNGAWADATKLVLTAIVPDRIRFHAHGMQSDLGHLHGGLPARIVPPRGGSIDLQDTMEGTLTVGISGDPRERTIDLYTVPERLADWARPGVTAHLEITLAETNSELAIPAGAVIQDGLTRLLFRRDPRDPDKVIRLDADLGVSDGRWVVIQSGLREGDEVVLDGIYQLMLATSASSPKGGHFHPDGSFHEGDE